MSTLAWLRQWLADRRAQREALVANVLEGSTGTTVWAIAQQTGLSAARVHAALIRMEFDGRVASDWQPGPHPRRRLYWLSEVER